MSKRGYPTDLIDKEWALFESLLPPAKAGGCNRSIETREFDNTMPALLIGTAARWISGSKCSFFFRYPETSRWFQYAYRGVYRVVVFLR